MDNKIKAFIDFIKLECKQNGIKVDLRKVKYIKMSDNIKCSGYFDSDGKVLVVAMNTKHWLETLVHEYAHFTQWRENCPAWADNIGSIEKVDEWIGGKNVKKINEHISKARNLELDNEIRSVRLIQDWGLDEYIDVNKYTQKANAYVIFYNWLRKTRKWSNPNNSPYGSNRIIQMMSTNFDMEYETLDSEIERAFLEEGI